MFVQAAATLTAASAVNAITIQVSNVTGLAPGQTVLIDNNTAASCPGPTSNRETRVIQSVGASSITLTTPLSLAHALGQMVAVLDNNVSSGTPHNFKLILVLLRDSMGHADIFERSKSSRRIFFW